MWRATDAYRATHLRRGPAVADCRPDAGRPHVRPRRLLRRRGRLLQPAAGVLFHRLLLLRKGVVLLRGEVVLLRRVRVLLPRLAVLWAGPAVLRGRRLLF